MRIRSLLAVGLGLLLAVPALASQLWFYEEVTACIVVLPYHHSSGSANGWVGISYLAASSTASLFIIARE